MTRLAALALAAASALLAAPAAPAHATVCAEVPSAMGPVGACVLGRGWVACAYDRRDPPPYVVVYVPGPGGSGC